MKKIFILTGEPSGDKLASTVITKLKIHAFLTLMVAAIFVGMLSGLYLSFRLKIKVFFKIE